MEPLQCDVLWKQSFRWVSFPGRTIPVFQQSQICPVRIGQGQLLNNGPFVPCFPPSLSRKPFQKANHGAACERRLEPNLGSLFTFCRISQIYKFGKKKGEARTSLFAQRWNIYWKQVRLNHLYVASEINSRSQRSELHHETDLKAERNTQIHQDISRRAVQT